MLQSVFSRNKNICVHKYTSSIFFVYFYTQRKTLSKMILEKEVITEESAAIHRFFDFTRSRVLSISAIEQIAEIPKNTLLNLLTTNRPIPANHIISLVRVLENFGYKTKWDWDIVNSQNTTGRLVTNLQKGALLKSIYFYFNYPNRKVRLHRGQCSFCNEGAGAQRTIHGEDNGGWRGPFDSYERAGEAAKLVAKEMGIEATNCSRCNPQNN
ncbi:hypothetical protein [Larkinella rosea]|uniref:Uncharacterized protein n=1 Tax=Larkinella rosea TaxID=2025312 RepID=A0A3P1C127_9BACT|nr:hypothetical protein [Larkinella rosea]RRB06836.1 hypothetical protein EHT25_03330 [Larkinella rosea]